MASSGSKSVAVTSHDTLTFSWSQSSQSIANNTTTISWSLVLTTDAYGRISSTAEKSWSVTVNGNNYSGKNTVGVGNNSSKTLASGSTTITHGSDGTKSFNYSFSQYFGITFSGSSIGTISGSGSGTLNTIPRKSSMSASNGTLGTAQTLTVSRKSTSFTHTITYKCGSTSGTVCTKSNNTSISWTPPLSLANQNTTGTSVSITFTITTYSGNTNVGSNTKGISCSIPASVKPTCTLTITDPTGHSDTYGSFVKGLSKFKVVVTPTTSYGSPIATYKTTANSSTYTAASFTTGLITKSGTLTILTTVTDKRGRTGTASVSKSVINYNAPVINKLTVNRCNEDGNIINDQGEYVKVTFSSTISGLDNKNTATYVLKYKKHSEGQFTEVGLDEYTNNYSVTNGYYVFPADTSSSYNIEFSVSDKHNTTHKTTTASTGFTMMHFNVGGDGMGIGKISELPGVLDIGMQTRHYGGLLHPVLEPETDLDDIRTPNTYVGENISTYNYSHCPLTSGTFTLEVVGMGDEGQVKQRLTYCHKTASRAWERIYYSGSWNYNETTDPTGGWVCVSDYGGTLLASPGKYMTAGHTANLAERVSKQKNGIVIVFSEYIDGAVSNTAFHTQFIPKMLVSKHPGVGYCFQMSTSNLTYFSTKYLYIHDDRIVGHDNNGLKTTGASGISYDNNRFVLRYVIGV